jgi:broad specificity phosphatase PhoE
MKIILVRHGQTQWNQVERFRGQIDVPLNEAGLAQAEAVARRIAARWTPTAVYSSSLSRAMVTAQKIAQPFGLTVKPNAGLIDINFGQWQGLSPDEAQERWPEQVWNWLHAPQRVTIPGGEPFEQVQSRALATVNELVIKHPGDTIVLVSHTVINRLILLGILNLGMEHFWTLRQDNCAINILEAETGRYVLATMNDTCHLH